MKIKFESAKLPATGNLVVLAASGAKLSALGRQADKTSGGCLTKAMKAVDFKGESGAILQLLTPAKLGVTRLFVIGIGDPDNLVVTVPVTLIPRAIVIVLVCCRSVAVVTFAAPCMTPQSGSPRLTSIQTRRSSRGDQRTPSPRSVSAAWTSSACIGLTLCCTDMGERYTIISSDSHAGGSMAMYQEYLADEWQEEFAEWRSAVETHGEAALKATALQRYRNK